VCDVSFLKLHMLATSSSAVIRNKKWDRKEVVDNKVKVESEEWVRRELCSGLKCQQRKDRS